ncbi:MAG: DNA polymerase III subunit chi [Gammaproteobacteria bacterium]|nr:DNA polymerase III subunit chi [Gammaproteobacteria bacterium]
MAQVDFYVLERVDEHARDMLACKLAEKAWRLENTIHIHAMTRADAERLDKLLWTFRDGSFVPHEMAGGDTGAPVTIGYGSAAVESRDLLITLCDDIPPFAESFPRVAELVTSDETCRAKSRHRYAAYRDQGHTMNTHKI